MTYRLLRDGKVILTNVDYFECLQYVHRNHCYSFDHALKYEGFKIEVVEGSKCLNGV